MTNLTGNEQLALQFIKAHTTADVEFPRPAALAEYVGVGLSSATMLLTSLLAKKYLKAKRTPWGKAFRYQYSLSEKGLAWAPYIWDKPRSRKAKGGFPRGR